MEEKKKSKIQIKCEDGTAKGTKVLINGKPLENVKKVVFTIDSSTPTNYPTVSLEVDGSPKIFNVICAKTESRAFTAEAVCEELNIELG